jgi:predicted ABC-type ATPase
MATPNRVAADHCPALYVLAGVDGAGKSSLVGAALRAHGVDYFDPDDTARRSMRVDPCLDRRAADRLASAQSQRLLQRAIAEGRTHAFETALDAPHLPGLLAAAAARGTAVHVWYAGLASHDLHVRRVAARGDQVAEADIRRSDRHSRLNLIELLPSLATLRLFDNSVDADPARGVAPHPRLLLHLQHGRVVAPDNLSATPEWARPIVAAALRLAA